MGTSHLGNQSSKPNDEKVVVIAEKKSPVSDRVARLVKVNGKLMCECPYACMGAMETCDFDKEFNWNNEKNAPKKFLKWFRLRFLTR